MKEQTLITVITSFVVLFAMMIAVYAGTSNSGGSAKFQFLGSDFEFTNNEVNFDELFKNEKYKKIAKDAAMKEFGLYEFNENEANEALITKIESLRYDSKFAKRLIDMRDRFIGPFKAPDIEATLVFDEDIPKDKAVVCPQGNLYNKLIGTALISDPKKMGPMLNASMMATFGCPVPDGEKETITVNPEVAKKFGIADLTAPVDAVAKALPSYIVIPNK